MGELSAIFKALSDPLRLRIVRLLLRNGKEAYGEELARALGIPAYRLSRHLKVLKTTGLIYERREGRWVYYSLVKTNGQLVRALRRIIAAPAFGGAGAKAPPTEGDYRRLATSMKRRRRVSGSRKPRTLTEPEAFNWDQGPAIPGIL